MTHKLKPEEFTEELWCQGQFPINLTLHHEFVKNDLCDSDVPNQQLDESIEVVMSC